MQKIFLTVCLYALTNVTNSYGMELIESLLTKASTFFNTTDFNTTDTNQKLWIKTINNQITSCNEKSIKLSALLTVAHQSGLFKNKKTALSIKIPEKDLALFIAASATQSKRFFNSLCTDDLYALATSAYILKSPLLYAYLLKTILPPDIDHHIASEIFSIKKIKGLMLKTKPSKTIHRTIEIPLLEKQTLTAHHTHDEQFHITAIKGILLNNQPYIQTIIQNVLNYKIIKEFNNYDILECHPIKNIIALGTSQKKNNAPTLILYSIDTDTITELVQDKNINLLSFSPDGNCLAAAYTDPNDTSISLWETTDTSKERSLIGHTEKIDALAFNPQSTKIISGSPEIKNCILLWNIENLYSITKTTALTNQHYHFKRFIFSKDGQYVLGVTHKAKSLFLPITNHKNYTAIAVNTPIYALFNAPTIPDQYTYINEKNNLVECYNPYTIIAAHRQPTDYSFVKANPHENLSAVYAKDNTLNLYRLSLQKKKVKNKKLNRHIDKIHSLEFNNDDLLLSACQLQTTIWNHKGHHLQTIIPSCHTDIAHLSRTGQYLFTTSSSKHNGYGSLCTEITEFFTPQNAHVYECIKNNLSTSQALLFKTLYKHTNLTPKNTYTIKKQSLEALTINSLTNPDESSLIHQLFMIAYGD